MKKRWGGEMWKRIALAVLLVALVGAGVAWLNRTSIILFMASRSSELDVGPTRQVEWLQGPETPSAEGEDRPPNVVFILADDLGINDISTFGGGVAGGRVPTPNIDRLAAEGAIFTQAYSGQATCAPSRAMLMTGRYATRTGFEFTPTPDGMGRIVPLIAPTEHLDYGLPPFVVNEEFTRSELTYAEMGLPPEEVTIAEVLRDRGYHTVHIGKWHLGREEQFRAVAQGFEESLLMGSGLYLPEDDPRAVNARLEFDPLDKFLWAQMKFAADYDRAGEDTRDDYFAPPGYITDYYTDEALRVIEANRNRPFFLYLAHWGPHNPLQATREDYEAVGDIQPHRLRVYAAMIRAVDRSVGRLMQKLEEEGLADNTVIVFSSDNGGAGYIGLPEVNAPYRGWKATLYEGGIRVPMFVRWPARIAPGTIVEEPAAHIDVMPSLAALAGASLPADREIDGRDVFSFATRSGAGFARPDDALFWSSGFYRVVRAGDWKLQVNARQGRKWLYDLAADPGEKVNLAEREPARLRQLEALLERHWADARPPLYPHSVEWPVRIDKTTADPYSRDDEYIIWPN
jgi:uncharacterized sulfatase